MSVELCHRNQESLCSGAPILRQRVGERSAFALLPLLCRTEKQVALRIRVVKRVHHRIPNTLP